MKFVLFLIKTLSLILCAGLLGAYLYYTFLTKEKSEFIANASLLLFVLSAVITSLTVMLTENKIKSNSGGAAGLDAYIADLRKEEKSAAKQIQKALPDNLVPMLEKVVAAMSDGKDGMERMVLDSKTAFSAALSENKTALNGILGDNQNAINNTISENIRLLESRMADGQQTLINKLESLLEQASNISAKTLPPLNLALENINTRLDDLESKIVSSRANYAGMPEETESYLSASVTEPKEPKTETPAPVAETQESVYDFISLPDEKPEEISVEADKPTEENLNDFTNLSSTPLPEALSEVEQPAEENLNDFTNLSDVALDEPSFEVEQSVDAELNNFNNDFTNLSDDPYKETTDADLSSALNGAADEAENKDNYGQFSNDLSDLADLEIMQEPVAPTAEPKSDEIDIDEFLKGRTDLKN